MPQMERTAEAIKRLEGVHVLKYLKPSTAQPGMPVQRPYHQLNNVGSSPCSLLLGASSPFCPQAYRDCNPALRPEHSECAYTHGGTSGTHL